eukprot:TRINITY_DN1539_c6_g1_i1.p1 TRINITY_DN1539_c6_g1~~TRINITY_DN1539_c6_g1_i1.p1  ORF type:complete len:500 (-),score=84.95 TRINITY_DN1539_c6_g1_i1:117-1616(-)
MEKERVIEDDLKFGHSFVEHIAVRQNIRTFSFFLVLIVIISIFYETGTERLEKWVKTYKKKTHILALQNVYREFMVLGFISFTLYIIENFGFVKFITSSFGEDEAFNKHLFEFVHILIFFVLISYIAIIIITSFLLSWIISNRWIPIENDIFRQQLFDASSSSSSSSSIPTSPSFFPNSPLPPVSSKESAKFQCLHQLRKSFLDIYLTSITPHIHHYRHHSSSNPSLNSVSSPDLFSSSSSPSPDSFPPLPISNFRISIYLKQIYLYYLFPELLELKSQVWSFLLLLAFLYFALTLYSDHILTSILFFLHQSLHIGPNPYPNPNHHSNFRRHKIFAPGARGIGVSICFGWVGLIVSYLFYRYCDSLYKTLAAAIKDGEYYKVKFPIGRVLVIVQVLVLFCLGYVVGVAMTIVGMEEETDWRWGKGNFVFLLIPVMMIGLWIVPKVLMRLTEVLGLMFPVAMGLEGEDEGWGGIKKRKRVSKLISLHWNEITDVSQMKRD